MNGTKSKLREVGSKDEENKAGIQRKIPDNTHTHRKRAAKKSEERHTYRESAQRRERRKSK